MTALSPLVSQHDVTWIASAMTDEDRAAAEEAGDEPFDEAARDGSPFRLRLVRHDAAAYDWFYNVVSNPTLWFVQHLLWDLAHVPNVDVGLYHAWHEGYVRVNEGFAGAVLAELETSPDAVVFFHDYHLYLAPRLVRMSRPDATLAHFVHIPWVQRDYWHVLPESMRRAVHDGLLANDVVAFHTERWVRNFIRASEEIVGASCDLVRGSIDYCGRRVLVTARPISVDTGEFAALAESPSVLAEERAIEARRPERMVLRVDRTDPSKNVVRGFRAFELFLEAHPELHRRVGMLALLDPSRQDIPEYAEYLGAIQRAARVVNDRFQSDGWAPIDLQIGDNFHQAVAAYKQFDVLLVNALLDGMNLVAKEAPLLNRRDGVLILSDNAGAHDEVGEWALSINPFDLAGQAEAIHDALTMPRAERARRLEALRAHVVEHDLAAWLEGILADVDRSRAGAEALVGAGRRGA